VRARPALAEGIAVAEALELCAATGTRTHLAHLSTARAVELVAEAKHRGLPVTAATCPHYLGFTDEDAARGGNVFKVNPSIKSAADRAALLDGLRAGIIDHVHSDHAPHTPAEKARNYGAAPSGIAGIQHQLLVLLELSAAGRLSLADVVRASAAMPAEAFALAPRGWIAPGLPADLVIVDPKSPTTVKAEDLLSRAQASPWTGHCFPHRIRATLVGGQVVWLDGEPPPEALRGERVA
jgi:dihydroorotase-like cyclic amidohydrolase